ncbi:MAG TPA: caspase family protein [Polyangiaceae bacterium]|nr:caspase family protein [Polyangiaceae bacterium]
MSALSIVLTVAALALASTAHAETPASPAPRTFAIVIANNRSTRALQPDLQYADDDGARYYRLFRAVADPADVALLTSFDRASRGQYAAIAELARMPTTRELLAARDRLLRNLEAARARGERTVLYVVYAGHGEMVDGRGVLDLEDRQIDGQFLERELIEKLPADTKHVLLDSCNSFFVMNPRKPGGRRWATPQDMAFGFSARHPEVGLFLSTNSESEVFEWSELESGVFSHEVRSGLSGGADVDADGAITYLELAGFFESANRGIARESLRPHLFYRGPRGDRDAPLFSSAALRGHRVVLGADETRLWIKSARGERLLDVHKEAMPMTLVVPEGEQGELALYVQTRDGAARRAVIEHVAPDGADPVLLASLEPRRPELGARGNRLFGELFATPYGPVALQAYEKESARTPEPVARTVTSPTLPFRAMAA